MGSRFTARRADDSALPARRRLGLIRSGLAVLLLCGPRQILRTAACPIDRRSVVVARVLGARQLAEAAMLAVDSAPRARLIGAGVDATHAATALALAARSERYRRPALINVAVAAALAAAGVAVAR